MIPDAKVAALFVETGGRYFGVPSVDPWDAERDARKYDGDLPVVAHPPCFLWVNLAAVNWKRSAQVGWFDRIKPTLSKREASRTPAAFADALVALALAANGTVGCQR